MLETGLSWLGGKGRPELVAMIHVGACPGTPHASHSVKKLSEMAVGEARLLEGHGVDAIILENMHDVPYLNRRVGPEVVACMSVVCSAVRGAVSLPLGVQVLAGANHEAMAVAQACDLQFIRCEGFVFSHVADEGLMSEAAAGPLLRYQRMIGAAGVGLIADIKKKHGAHAITADIDLAECAKAAAFAGADGVVVTGTATGQPTQPDDVALVSNAVDEPVFVGSGVTPDNVARFADSADAVIVGSFLKHGGFWENGPDPDRVEKMVKAVAALEK